MDLSSFKLDIDELIDDFAKSESTSFADMKKIWLQKKFTFIYESRPSSKLGFFMQSLYAHSFGHMFATASFPHKLGGLYCLYCLHETQPFKPPFRIYLSLGELKKLRNLVIDAKKNKVNSASALVERMLQRNMFLFGFVDMNDGCIQERVNELTDVQNAHIQLAYKKILEDTPIEHFLHLDLGMELDLQGLKSLSANYTKAKEAAIKEASEVMDVHNIEHILENQASIGDVAEKITEDWNLQKVSFFHQTGSVGHAVEERQQQDEDNEIYVEELDMLLSQI